MSPLKKDKEPNLNIRRFRPENVGFICVPYTSHFYKAGRSKRVTVNILVRLLDYKTYNTLDSMSFREMRTQDKKKDWLI